MTWRLRHEGSPQSIAGLSLDQIAAGLRDDRWETTAEVMGPGETTWQAIENHPQLADLAAELDAPAPRRHDEPTSLDLNALIDVCLVLLIFFILTTAYASVVQKVVPVPRTQDNVKGVPTLRQADLKKLIRVQASVDKKGAPTVRVENQAVDVLDASQSRIDRDKLREVLRPYTRGDDRKTEVLLDASGITWEDAIAIQDGAGGAGIHVIKYLKKKE